MERKIPGRKEPGSLIKIYLSDIMPTGQLTRYEILSRVYRLKDELKDREELPENKYLADEYLNKVLDYINEFRL